MSAGHLGSLAVGGASTAFTLEPTTALVAGTKYQLNTTARRRLDPSVALTVEVDADGAGAGGYVTAADSAYRVDYLFGVVTFASSQGGSATVRVSGSYITTLPVAEVRSASYEITSDFAERAVFGDDFKLRDLQLVDLSGEVTLLKPPATDLDPGAGLVTFQNAVAVNAPMFIEIGDGGSEVLRAWVKFPGLSQKLTPGSLLETTLKFAAFPFQGAGQTEYVAFGHGTP